MRQHAVYTNPENAVLYSIAAAISRAIRSRSALLAKHPQNNPSPRFSGPPQPQLEHRHAQPSPLAPDRNQNHLRHPEFAPQI